MRVLTLVRMESIFGSIAFICGSMRATSSIMPELSEPLIVPPGSMRCLMLFESRRLSFRLPIRSASTSAVEPAGILRFLSTSMVTTIPSWSP